MRLQQSYVLRVAAKQVVVSRPGRLPQLLVPAADPSSLSGPRWDARAQGGVRSRTGPRMAQIAPGTSLSKRFDDSSNPQETRKRPLGLRCGHLFVVSRSC